MPVCTASCTLPHAKAMQTISEEDEPLSEPRKRRGRVTTLPGQRPEAKADDGTAVEVEVQATADPTTSCSASASASTSSSNPVSTVTALAAKEDAPPTRQQRVSDFIRAAETGSHDILERFYALCLAYADVEAELPPHVRAIIATLRKAKALPPHLKPRDGRRGLDFGLAAAAKAWGLSREALEAFFDKAYLSRSMIAKMRQLAEREPDFARARQLLEAAQRERRRRGEAEGEENDDDDGDGGQQGDKHGHDRLKKWTGVSREAIWVPGDIERAMAAATREKQAGGHDTNNDNNNDDSSSPSVSPPVEMGRRFDPSASEQQRQTDRHHTNMKRNLADSLADSPVQIQADVSFEYDFAAANDNDDDVDLTHDHRDGRNSAPLTPVPAKRQCLANISHIRRRIDGDSGSKHGSSRLDLTRSSSPLDDSFVMLIDGGVSSSPSPSPALLPALPPVFDLFSRRKAAQHQDDDGDNQHQDDDDRAYDNNHDNHNTTTPGQNPLRHPPLLLPPSKLRGDLAPGKRLSDVTVYGLLSVLTAPLSGQFATVDPLIAVSASSSSALSPALSGHAAPTLLVPVFVTADAHWVLAVIHRRAAVAGEAIPVVELYDSLPSPAHQCEAARVVNGLYARLFPDDSLQKQPWTIRNRLAPVQHNDFDCGLYVVVVAAHLVAGLGLPATVDAPCWRHLLCALLSPDDDHDYEYDDNDNDHNADTLTLHDLRLTTAKDWLQLRLALPSPIPQPPPTLVGHSDNAAAPLQSFVDASAAHLDALSHIFNSACTHATHLQTALATYAQTVADASAIFRHIQVVATASSESPYKDTDADGPAASLHRISQESTHWHHLAQLDDTAMPRQTIQDALAACQRRLAQIRTDVRTRARHHADKAESRRAMRRAVPYCAVLHAQIAEHKVAVNSQVKRLRAMRWRVDGRDALEEDRTQVEQGD
ncbi:hypothetical protein B0J13DRAFT_555990 [Dactylonectria estremocensis]|uniref:Ubiquitin-like protease family profile domain-containing protein n=1 Tax=Dactylonectria estremocensis TaxID=1079267 RepID=A0A9P9ERW7_9HYPO|nr:hypothetical protein B0J13DRAFT_555990 [Dactylonectria estremocensis]